MTELLPDQLAAVHRALRSAGVPHAFGGAVALAYYATPRATYDIDVNIFLPAEAAAVALDALAPLLAGADRSAAAESIARSAQARMTLGRTPIDLFFDDLPYHAAMAGRVRSVPFDGLQIPILSVEDVVICKAVYDRPKDWLDIESIAAVGAVAPEWAYLSRWLEEFYPPQDSRVTRLAALFGPR